MVDKKWGKITDAINAMGKGTTMLNRSKMVELKKSSFFETFYIKLMLTIEES